MNVDRVDRAIISELSQDSRLSIRELAGRVHVSRTAAHNRVQRLIADGVISGFVATVDRKALGLHVTAIVIVKVGDVVWSDLAAALAELPYVENVQAVSGDIDFVLTVSAPDHERLSEVIMRQIHAMPGVASTRSYVVLDEHPGTAPGVMMDIWPVRAP
jgi:DNA-binding Lrp family transcriptional regulator